MKVNKSEAKEVITVIINEWIRKGYAIAGYTNPDELVNIVWEERNPNKLTTLQILSKEFKISILWWEYLGVDISMRAVKIDTNEDLFASVTKKQAKEIIKAKVHDWISQGLAINGYGDLTSLVNKAWHEDDPDELQLLLLDNAQKKLSFRKIGKDDIIMFAQ